MNIQDLKITYDTIAHDYHRDHARDTWDDAFLDLFAGQLQPGATVLDLGCGPGVETKKLVAKRFSVSGFDLSPELLKIAKENAPEASFQQGDMRERLPYEDDFFDGVFAKASLLHIPKREMGQVLREIARVMKPGGILHIAVKRGEGEKVIGENDYGYEYERFFSFWTESELAEHFEQAHLEILNEGKSQKPGGATVWLQYIVKKRI